MRMWWGKWVDGWELRMNGEVGVGGVKAVVLPGLSTLSDHFPHCITCP